MRTPPRAMPAIVTPFDISQEFDAEAHAANVVDLMAEGSNGFVVAGSTGEGPYLEPDERTALVAATRQAAPDAFVLCGINAESVRQAAAQIAEADTGGADAVLVATPGTLVRDNHLGVERFFRDVADHSPIPVFLYTVPRVTGYALPTDVVNRLADVGNIVGIKDSGGDPTRILDLHDAIESGFYVFAGASRALAESHHNGGFGAITASANYAFRLVEQAAAGDDDAQQQLVTLTAVVEQFGVTGTKYAAGLAGRTVGAPRAPLAALSPDDAAVVKSAVHSALQRKDR